MRISDWSSDVCSSDLLEHISVRLVAIEKGLLARQPASPRRDAARAVDRRARKAQMLALHLSGRHVIDDGGRTARQRLARRALRLDARALPPAPGQGALAHRTAFQFMLSAPTTLTAPTVQGERKSAPPERG